jgi:chemotaxis protein methyltransferase CheR
MTLAIPSDPAAQAEFTLGTAEFDRVRQLIHQRAGISLHPGKRAMVYSRLARRLRETGRRSFGEYLLWLEQDRDTAAQAEWQEFVNALTTNLTAFFRERHHFDALAQDLLARSARCPGRPLRLWCNAASTGEEPYSLAMTVIETLGPDADVRLLCTDIDTRVLETARRGIYEADARGLEPQHLRRHFLRGTGAHAGRIRVRPELTRLTEFRAFNLAAAHWPGLDGAFDVIFCRNVMIYFDAATQRGVLQRMHRALKPGGLLFAGHSENFTDARELFRLRGQTLYERV